MGILYPQFVEIYGDGHNTSSEDIPEDLLQLSYEFYNAAWALQKVQMEEVFNKIKSWKE